LVLTIDYPLYKQCDPAWGNDQMGVVGQDQDDDTICHQGCAMSSVSMVIAGYNISIDGEVSTPKTLNQWLRKNNGYTCMDGDCCNLVLNAPDRIAPTQIKSLGEPLTPALNDLVKMVSQGEIAIAHVRNRTHFVLLTGFTQPDIFTVLDPAYPATTYTYDEIHDILLYQFFPLK